MGFLEDDTDFVKAPKKAPVAAGAALQEYELEGIKVKFPFAAYPSQLDMMGSVCIYMASVRSLTRMQDYSNAAEEGQVSCASGEPHGLGQVNGHSLRGACLA